MKIHVQGTLYLMVAVLSMIGWGCSGMKSVSVIDNRDTTTDPASKEDEYRPVSLSGLKGMKGIGYAKIGSIQGTARVQFSAPGVSERIITEFTSSRNQMYLELRNTLGIVGAEVLSGPDSVTILNKMDKLALRLSVDDYNQREDIRLRLPLNFLSIFDPLADSTSIDHIQENQRNYKMVLKDGNHLVVDKKQNLPVSMVIADTTSDRFTTFMYEAFEETQGMRLPRRIQAFTTDRKSRIRIELSRLEINPKDTIFVLTVPSGIPIYR